MFPKEIYADDTTLHHEHSKLPSGSTYPALQQAIDCTKKWAESWHGKFDHAKTRILSTNKDILLETLTPTMEEHDVTVADNHRRVGVVRVIWLPQNWSKHAQCIMAAASERAGLLRRRLTARDLRKASSPSGINTLCLLCLSCAGICQSCVARLSPGRGRNVQCPWDGYRPVLHVVLSKLTGLRLRQSKTLEDALLITNDDFGKTFRRSASSSVGQKYFWPTDDAERRNVLPKSSFVINKASSSVLLCLNHNHEGDIEKVVWISQYWLVYTKRRTFPTARLAST